MSGYTYAQIQTMRDEYDSLNARFRQHSLSCEVCFIDGPTACRSAMAFESDLESLFEAIGYTAPSQEDSDLVAEYVTVSYNTGTTSVERDRRDGENEFELDVQAENYADLADAWLRSREGRYAIENDESVENELAAENALVWIDDALFRTTQLLDEGATQGALRAHARIWNTRRGEIGVYKTFIRNVRIEKVENELSWSFDAYCSVCKKSVHFEDRTRQRLTHFIMTVIRHAHTHVPDSVIETATDIDGNIAVTLSGSDAFPTPGSDRAADVAFVKRAGNSDIEWLLLKHRTTGLTAHERALGRAWREFLEQLDD